MVIKAIGLGADVGVGNVVEQTADETVDEVLQKLLGGDQQLWSATKDGKFVGTIVTQIEVRAGEMILVVKYMAGKTFKEWLPELHDAMAGFAKETGCVAIETHSREALRKPLMALGWSKVAVLYRVSVNG